MTLFVKIISPVGHSRFHTCPKMVALVSELTHSSMHDVSFRKMISSGAAPRPSSSKSLFLMGSPSYSGFGGFSSSLRTSYVKRMGRMLMCLV